MSEKIKVTDENMSEVFNTSIYPKLDASKEFKDVSSVINDILDEFSFDDETMKVRFMITALSVISDRLLRSMDHRLQDLDPELKSQVGWNFVNLFFNNGQFNPMKLINYADILNPTTESLFTNLNVVDPETMDWLQSEAQNILDYSKEDEFKIHEDAVEHIENIAKGNLPFGLKKLELK